MSPSGQAIWNALRRAVRRVRTDAAIAVAAAVAALVPAALLVGWVAGPAWGLKGVGPLLVWAAGLAAAAGLAWVLGRRWWRSVDDLSVAAAAERRRRLPEGSVRGIIELARGLPAGSSAALFRRSETEVAASLAGATPDELAGDLGTITRRRRTRLLATLAGLTLLTAVAGFAAPERARDGWSPLAHPVRHLRGPVLPPLEVVPGDADVPRGGSLRVTIAAPLRTEVAVHWRAVGDVPRSRSLAVGDAGRAAATLGPVTSPVQYWVRAPDGALTDTFHIRPVDPLMMRGLALDVVYPAYVGREADHFQGDIPPLRVPEGTTLRIRGSATRPLRAVALEGPEGARLDARVERSGFALDWRVDRQAEGQWTWSMASAEERATVPPPPLDISVTADAPPEVRVTVPGADTVLSPSLRQPIVADASDDYGLAAAELVYRTVSMGRRGPETRASLPVEPGADRTLLATVLDANGQRLVPGDAVEYHVAVRDNSPAGQWTRSATFRLRLPSMSELRDAARDRAAELLERAEQLAGRSRDLETATRDLSRRAASDSRAGQPGGTSGQPQQPGKLAFEQASDAEQVVGEHEDVLQQVAELRDRMEELRRAVEDAGLHDPELQRRLAELRDLYRQLATPELEAQLQALREAVDQLDPEAVKRALEQLAERQEEFRRQVEETLELMRRAAAEQEMNALAREAEEIAAQQEALAAALQPGDAEEQERAEGEGETEGAAADSAAAPPSAEPTEGGENGEAADSAAAPPSGQSPPPGSQGDPVAQQEELERRTEEVKQSLQSLQKQLLQMGEQGAGSQTGQAKKDAESAQQSMQQAADQAKQDQGQQASESGKQAAQSMSSAARTLDRARREMAEARKREAQQAVQQATQEALSLAQREEALRQQMQQAQQQGGQSGDQLQQMRSEQAALQQGLQQLGRNVSEAGQRSSMVDQAVGQALARAMLNMQQTLEGMEPGQPMPVQQAERTVESLNQLAMQLLQNDAQIQQSQAGGAMQQALQQLAQLAQEQASLNGQVGAVAPMELGQQALAQQLHQMAQQQRGIARRVGNVSQRMGGREDVLGSLDAMASEADAIARELEGGRLDPEVMARQERLFHRMLDAGRSLEKDEYSDERVGAAPGDPDVAPPAALDPALLEGALRYPAPSEAELRALPPAYRRLILEYFDRLNRGGASEGQAARPAEGGG